MAEESSIFKFISNNTYTHEGLNNLCLNYEKDIKEQAVKDYRRSKEYHKVKKIKEDIIERDRFANQVLEYLEDLIYEIKEKYSDYYARSKKDNVQA